MGETNASTSGDAAATSGAADGGVKGTQSNQQSTSGDSGSGGTSHTEKLLKEKRNAMSRVAELEAQIQSMKDEKLTEKEEYKTLAEQRQKRVQELEQQVTADKKLREKARKVSAVKKHLVSMGLQPKHEEIVLNKLLDVEDLVIDPDTNAVLGAEEKAKTFRQSFADLGFFGKQGPGVNQDAPLVPDGNSSNSGTGGDLSKLSREQLRDKLADTFKNQQ